MAKPPSHRAYIVIDPKNDDAQAQWHPVGAVWPHGDAKGFDLVLVDQVSVAGRLVCRAIEPQSDRPAEQPAQRREGAKPRPR
jgi:hypothetical protein